MNHAHHAELPLHLLIVHRYECLLQADTKSNQGKNLIDDQRPNSPEVKRKVVSAISTSGFYESPVGTNNFVSEAV